jgi:hypothetical protein
VPDTRDIKNIRARLERWELTHLRALAASLNDQLEAATERAIEAEGWASSLQHQAEMLQQELMQLCDESGAHIGLTQQGDVVVLKPTAPVLQPGERYAGIVLDADGEPIHHLVLMAQRPTDKLNWQAATDWATNIGGTLPTRQEQALLYANCKPHLKADWHWSSETHADDASYAWYCIFGNGSQGNDHKSYEGCAVAVRRLVIQSFNPLDGDLQ